MKHIPQSIIDADFSDRWREPRIAGWIWIAPTLLIDCAIAWAFWLWLFNVVQF